MLSPTSDSGVGVVTLPYIINCPDVPRAVSTRYEILFIQCHCPVRAVTVFRQRIPRPRLPNYPRIRTHTESQHHRPPGQPTSMEEHFSPVLGLSTVLHIADHPPAPRLPPSCRRVAARQGADDTSRLTQLPSSSRSTPGPQTTGMTAHGNRAGAGQGTSNAFYLCYGFLTGWTYVQLTSPRPLAGGCGGGAVQWIRPPGRGALPSGLPLRDGHTTSSSS